MAQLITLDRARAQIPAASSCDDTVLAAMIDACSTMVENYCGRSFEQATYDELYTVAGVTSYLEVRNPPIIKVNGVRYGQLPALYVQFNDPANVYQFANIEVSTTGVTLSSMLNAVPTTNTFLYSAYSTFSNLCTAINALGTPWQATLTGQFQGWQTSDMVRMGTFGARNQSVPLTVYWQWLSFFETNYEMGEIYLPGGAIPGYQDYRVQYLGGFADIPEDLQQAVAELVQLTFASRTANPLMSSETLDKYSYTRAATTSFGQLSITSKKAIDSYRLIRVARYK